MAADGTLRGRRRRRAGAAALAGCLALAVTTVTHDTASAMFPRGKARERAGTWDKTTAWDRSQSLERRIDHPVGWADTHAFDVLHPERNGRPELRTSWGGKFSPGVDFKATTVNAAYEAARGTVVEIVAPDPRVDRGTAAPSPATANANDAKADANDPGRLRPTSHRHYQLRWLGEEFVVTDLADGSVVARGEPGDEELGAWFDGLSTFTRFAYKASPRPLTRSFNRVRWQAPIGLVQRFVQLLPPVAKVRIDDRWSLTREGGRVTLKDRRSGARVLVEDVHDDGSWDEALDQLGVDALWAARFRMTRARGGGLDVVYQVDQVIRREAHVDDITSRERWEYAFAQLGVDASAERRMVTYDAKSTAGVRAELAARRIELAARRIKEGNPLAGPWESSGGSADNAARRSYNLGYHLGMAFPPVLAPGGMGAWHPHPRQ
jgi:hypothetical protein